VTALERVNFTRKMDEQMRIRKELNRSNLVNQQTPKMNKGDRKKQAGLESTRGGKNKKIMRISKYLVK
jgi:hypothetical protein